MMEEAEGGEGATRADCARLHGVRACGVPRPGVLRPGVLRPGVPRAAGVPRAGGEGAASERTEGAAHVAVPPAEYATSEPPPNERRAGVAGCADSREPGVGEEEVEGVAAAAEAGRRAPETLVVAGPSATRHTDTGHSSQPLAASAGASDSTYSGADAEEAVAGGGSGAAGASAAATAEEDKRVRALRMALQHKTQMPVTDEEARAILQARGGRETPVTEVRPT
ncbi:hypothetical protein EMIHUDRAFT_214741 [Emiliania huxleyi CCMP1516]|uniref:Peroxin-14 n=2 Tax=Emiliania huxleyi TaxID=2903 RepID=A0A0D3IJF2_EMIH1|nr:hypothetical protein EMIHUDRAFT_214741 [Emiliania huxleyi CCMP1516]EOD11387.1 hypothetical protein EMIHUDRAFT_214741 [Emiliania huxleyi CCMP1516]|eukprot:XP_005763816.1 hypothetical protein EMIHUDRAFT_214741 [Emiliania huxleyi CCMP1516]